MRDPQPSREPFRIVTPHREGCKGDFEIDYPMDARTVEMTCTLRHREGKCNGRATADLPALFTENAELRAEVADWKLKAEDEFLKRSATEAEVLRMTAIASHLANGVSRRLKGITTDLALLYLLDDPDVRALLDTDTAGGQ